ncbi:DUF7133 domain-containing protein [Portibacter marinus]|uniref:DUF7133 domain-containing protein n=1 Tax=Portibacter marinus TaxID=2898660 RepID=UPI001F42FF5C|nr:c-type cytochrome [Portibacter marinus]
MIYFRGLLLCLLLNACQIQEIDLSSYHIQDSELLLEVVASEEHIKAPVAIDFDKSGRLWVAEMPDYMPDINGQFEKIPAGRIVILEDRDGDGYMEHSTVFKDSIHQLRALRLFRNGILYADDPNLYFSEIKNDRPDHTVIIDSTYALGGNVEHKPNGLIKSMDNCFYSAKSHYRYCFENNQWIKEAVFFRGQWGITEDQNGRIYTNDNSNLFFGDAFLPGILTHNKYLKKVEGINEDLVKNRSVYPAHATAVNRGYNDNVLDSEGKLRKTTSACGPYIHQTSSLGKKYEGSAFVCVPEANLIKHLNVNTNDFRQEANFDNDSSEFLVSTDEAFRPVNLATGPDGNLYIVDFHRGIIQHKIYMTSYLKNQIEERKLDEITNMGRILKVKSSKSTSPAPAYNFEHKDSLIHYLGSHNPWVRRMAQEGLIYSTESRLDDLLMSSLEGASKLKKIHLLWTLQGRKSIDVLKIKQLEFSDPWVIANLFKILTTLEIQNPQALADVFKTYRSHSNPVVRNHLLASSYILYNSHPDLHRQLWLEMEGVLPAAQISAIPSGQYLKYSDSFEEYNQAVANEDVFYIHKQRLTGGEEDGYFLYNEYCSSCHGYGGNGAEGQAPSLVGSKIINAKVEAVPLVIINGLEGMVTIDGERQEYSSIMPAMMHSADLNSADITKITNYIYNAFRDEVAYISQEKVDSLIDQYEKRTELWNEDELLGTE